MKKSSRKRRRPAKKALADVPTYCVFVSHATYDKFVARTICEKIEAIGAGISTFRDDRDIQGGDKIPEEIKNAIRNCHEVAVVLTPKSVARQWVLVEIGMSEIVERRIVPLFYHIDLSDVPEIIRDRRGYTLDEIDGYLKDLERRAREFYRDYKDND